MSAEIVDLADYIDEQINRLLEQALALPEGSSEQERAEEQAGKLLAVATSMMEAHFRRRRPKTRRSGLNHVA